MIELIKNDIKAINNEKTSYLLIFISTIIWGFVAHGFMMFNKIALHDESLEIFGQDLDTISQGRWMQEYIRRFEVFLFRDNRLSTTYLYAIYAFLVCALFSCVIYRHFRLKGYDRLIVWSGVVVTCPSMMICFGYSYFTPYYLTGFLFAVLSIYFAGLEKRKICFVLSVVFLCLSMGVYQSWMTFGLSILFLILFYEIERSEYNFKDFVKNGVYYLLIPVLASLFYFIINKTILTVTNTEMISYAGLDTMGATDLAGYIGRIQTAYSWFVAPPNNEMNTFFPLTSIWIYRILLLLSGILMVCEIITHFRNGKKNVYQIILMVIVFPLSIFSILIVGGTDYLTPLNLMTWITLVLFFLQRDSFIPFSEKMAKNVGVAITVLVLCLDVFYVRFDNSNYLKAEIVQNEMREWFSGLSNRIRSCEGYDDELPVLYVNEWAKSDVSLTVNQAYYLTPIWPYALNEDYLLNDFAWRAFMKNQCGFNPRTIELDNPVISDEDRVEFDSMPSYPDYGSIKRMGDYIVIKF